LEAGGDALVRSGIRAPSPGWKVLLFATGGLVLFSYARLVNASSWDFGRLLGVYVVFFFIVAQIISWVAFSQKPGPAMVVGGAFVVVGGVIMTFA
jgi:hypothetical protein